MFNKFICILIVLISTLFAKAQELPYNPRKWDLNHTYVKFTDQFDNYTVNSSKWEVIKNFGRGNCVFVDSVGVTYFVNGDTLNLNMMLNNSYAYYNYDESKWEYPDYMAAEISTRDSFKYGIYEGRMKFAGANGSWPAFWIFGGNEPETPEFRGVCN